MMMANMLFQYQPSLHAVMNIKKFTRKKNIQANETSCPMMMTICSVINCSLLV